MAAGFGMAPSLIITAGGAPALVHAMWTLNGIEYQLNAKWKLHSYYSGTNIGKYVTIDQWNGMPVGYGYTGSPNSQNRTIQEVSGGFTRVVWKNPNYGAFQ